MLPMSPPYYGLAFAGHNLVRYVHFVYYLATMSSCTMLSLLTASCTILRSPLLQYYQNCFHDRGTMNACSNSCLNQYGYRSPNGGFRTIMAYACQSGQCDNHPGTSCPAIGYCSGNHQYNEETVGGGRDNCAQEIVNMKGHIQSYR
jgi:hypothetical protein